MKKARICDFDPFGKSKYVYNFVSTEKSDSSLTLDDGTAKIFISTQGEGEVRKELKDFLSYIKCSTAEEAEKSESLMLRNLNARVADIKENRNAEARYMVYEKLRFEAVAEGHIDGYIEGHEAGIAKGHEDGYTEGREAGIAEGREAGITEGREACMKNVLRVVEQYKKGETDAEQAAEKLGITKEEFLLLGE